MSWIIVAQRKRHYIEDSKNRDGQKKVRSVKNVSKVADGEENLSGQ